MPASSEEVRRWSRVETPRSPCPPEEKPVPASSFIDYYECLQLSPNADQETIERVYRLLAKLCADGLSVLFYSSDDEELLGLCDRVLVMHDGIVRSELAGETLTKSNLVAASLGASRESMQ